jgi:hypothetical protein
MGRRYAQGLLLLFQASTLNYIVYQRWGFKVLGLHELLRYRLKLGTLDQGCQLVKVPAAFVKLAAVMTSICKVIF